MAKSSNLKVPEISVSKQDSTNNIETVIDCQIEIAQDSEMDTAPQDSNHQTKTDIPCNNSISSPNSKSQNVDDPLFVKPQNSYIRVKQNLNLSEDAVLDIAIAKTQTKIDNSDIYNNPKPSSSKDIEEINLTPSNMNIGPPSNVEDPLQIPLSTSEKKANTQDVIGLKNRLKLYAPDTGPQMYAVKGNLVTRPLISKNLPDIFKYLPICGKPGPDMNLQQFYRNKIREYVGCDLDDQDFNDLENYCNPELLKTGQELQMETNVPVMGVLNTNSVLHNNFSKPETEGEPPNLVTLRKNKIRMDLDVKRLFTKKLKYRGVRILPFTQDAKNNNNREMESQGDSQDEEDVELKPGEDILYRVRVYRPYTYSMTKERYTRTRHSIFNCDIILTGRHKLTALRDRFVCHNDFDMRVDVSDNPDTIVTSKAKDLFPSGFLFINNVFYVDTRKGCIDNSAPIREWAIKRKIGDFPKKDMCQVKLQDLVLKLGYPEVYIHQGNCEHLFVFSEIRLLGPADPLRFSNYPCSTAIGQNQTVYCTTCAEFSAKWIVVGSDRVPFDPGFLCDTCFRQYLYIDGKKIGNFKAYRYRGNALNVLKP